MPARKKLDSEAIVERIRRGESITAVAKSLGVNRQAVRYWMRKAGVESRHKRPLIPVEIDGEWMSMTEASCRYGIQLSTLLMRYKNGDRGKRLVRPVRENRPPEVYELGYSVADWQIVAAYGAEVGPYKASKRMSLPLGAVKAAMQGDYARLD